METFELVLDVAAIVLTLAYYLLTLVRGTQRTRLLCGNLRAYTLVCEYAPLLFLIGGLLGTLLLSFDRWNGALRQAGIDLPALAGGLGLRFDEGLLRYTRWALFLVGGWFLLLGVLTAALGRREVFGSVEDALRYYVQQRRAFTAASYVVTAAATRDVPETADPADRERWRHDVDVIHAAIGTIDEAMRPSWQGGNVRLELACGDAPKRPTVTRHVWRFGPHAYLVAEVATPPGERRAWGHSRRGLREFRALVGAIRALVSVHGR